MRQQMESGAPSMPTTKSQPSISIIINNYNYCQYLDRCITSALEQDYGNFEVVVVDDGSTDTSREVIERFAGQVFAVFQENGGQGAAVNAGFAASSGELVIFLDSDDYLLHNCLKEVAANWQPEYSKLHFNLAIVDREGVLAGRNYIKQLPSGDQSVDILRKGTVKTTPTSGNVFARWFLQRVMPIEPENLWVRGIDAYLFNIAALAGPIGAVQESLGAYRLHGSNVSGMLGPDGGISRSKLNWFILREVRTDELLAKWSGEFGKNFRSGTLTSAAPHLQLLFIHCRLFDGRAVPFHRPAGLVLADFVRRFMSDDGVSRVKVALISLWMLAILLVPKRAANSLAVFGYRRRMFLAVAPT